MNAEQLLSLNLGHDFPHMFIAEVEFVPNRTLCCGVLPNRIPTGLERTLNRGRGIFTSVDLKWAKHFGYQIYYEFGFYWEESAPVAKDMMERLYARRLAAKDAKNNSEQKILKTLMCSIYGKFAQRAVKERIAVAPTQDQLDAFASEYRWTGFSPVAEDGIVLFAEDEQPSNKPVQIAAFITAYARGSMWEIIDIINPGMQRMDLHPYYWDTDCLYMFAKQYEKLRELGYVNKRVMGKLSNDLDDQEDRVKKAVFVAPKLKVVQTVMGEQNIWPEGEEASLRDDQKMKITAKGFPLYLFRRKEMWDSIWKVAENRMNVESGLDTRSLEYMIKFGTLKTSGCARREPALVI